MFGLTSCFRETVRVTLEPLLMKLSFMAVMRRTDLYSTAEILPKKMSLGWDEKNEN